MAIDATQKADQFIDAAIFAKKCDALGIAMASSIEFHLFDDIPFVGNRHRPGASPAILMGISRHAYS